MKHLFLFLFFLLLAIGSKGNTLAQFRTFFGDMEVELFDQHKPITVNNFIRYVRSGLYQDGFIHRCDPDFVIQGGGFYVEGPYVMPIPIFPPIRNEFGAGAVYSNVYGTIAMAKLGGDTNSATSQWFINLKNNNFLDAPNSNNFFTVFGRVIRGTNVLNQFKTFGDSDTQSNVISNCTDRLGPAFGELPLLTPNLTYNDLLYVDITLLSVQVRKLANDVREISWNSVAGKTNHIEFTTNLPPSWQTLVTTNGDGNRLVVTDAASSAPRRFYRVRVQY